MSLDFLTHVRTESGRFSAALAGVDPTTRVPSCPDWSAADLLWHLTEVHSFWTAIVRDRLATPDAAEAAAPERPGEHDAALELFARSTAELVEALAGADDATAVWTWAPEQTVGFVRRFQAHEALMHRVDAELTAGMLTASLAFGPPKAPYPRFAPQASLTPLPAELADDGIDVVLRYSMTWRPPWASWTRTGVVGALHATDTGRRTTIGLGTWGGDSPDTGKSYAAELALELLDDAEATTFEVSAPAADLDAWLWSRPGFGEVSVSGARSDFDAFAALVAKGVQ